MPMRHKCDYSTKMRALSLVDESKSSIRKVSNILKIPKSTLHDNLPNYRANLASFIDLQDRPEYYLVRNILIQVFEAKSSARASAMSLSKIMNVNLSHQKVLLVLDLAAETVNTYGLGNPSFEAVCSAAFDEIFQCHQPILGFVDPLSAVISIKMADDRSSDTWASFLTFLKALGLKPKSTVTDGGTGLHSGIRQIFSDSIQVRDLFHVLNKLLKAKRILEGKCYALIAAFDKAQAKNATDDLEVLNFKMNEAITLFDLFETKIRKFKKACYFGQDEDPCYISADKLRRIVDDLLENLDQIQQNISNHRSIHEAYTYLKSGSKSISAYKDLIEKSVNDIFGPINNDVVLRFICPIIEYLDQYRRSHDSREKQGFWGKKIAELRTSLRQCLLVDQNEVDRAITIVSQLMDEVKKSNSLMETVNSVIRCHLQSYKSIPRWFCPLFTYFWNHRKFARGLRKDCSPNEILSGQKSKGDWVDKLLENFPFERLCAGNKATIQARGEDNNQAA